MVCNKPKELEKISQKMDNAQSYDEWAEYDSIADEICFKISECHIKCGNQYCYGLQNSDAINLAFEEEQADNLIRDSLPDDEYF